jgi:hypothetical protein
MDMPQLKFSEFAKFFAEQSPLSNNVVIAEFREASKLACFETHQLKMIYSAAEQFIISTRVRVAQFASKFVDPKSTTKILYIWFLRRDQIESLTLSLAARQKKTFQLCKESQQNGL